MPTHTRQAPTKGAQTSGHKPETSAFQPRPFGETAPAEPETPLEPEARIERAARFGHNLTQESVSSSGEAPIQRVKWWEKLLGGSGKPPDDKASKPLLADEDDAEDHAPSVSSRPLVSSPPRLPPSPSPSLPRIGPLPAVPKPAVVVPRLAPPPVPVEDPAARVKRLAREADKTKLQTMLKVNDDLIDLDPSPNKVTSAELNEIAELYSKIREGDSHIKLANKSKVDKTVNDNAMSGGDFDTFKGKALEDIAKILQTPAGRTVLKSLGAGGKSGTGDYTIGNAPNSLHAAERPHDRPKASDGTGSGSEVYYSAGTEVDSALSTGALKSTSDTVLFHELVHAYHSGQGTRKQDSDVIDPLETVFGSAADADVGVKREESATVGLDTFAGDAITENAYRASHREIAGANQALADKYKKRQSYN